jgi:Na+/melibiose symporter-like transporter
MPVVVLALVLGKLFVPTSRDPEASRLDIPGAVLSILGLVALVWAIIEGPHGWTDGPVLVGFGAAAVLLGAFGLWEARTRYPMLDISLFRNARFSAASGAIMLTFFAMFGTMFLLTQFLQSVLGYTPLETGVRFLPMAATMMVIAPNSARLVERIGTKRVVATGLIVAAIGLLLMSRLSENASYTDVVISLVVMSAGLALVMPPCTESIMGSLPRAKAGVGSAVNDTTREIGGALGVAILGSVLSSSYRPDVQDAVAGSPLPATAVDAVSDQIGAAMEVARDIGGAPGQALADAAGRAFVDGQSVSFVIGAAALALGAVIVALFLPARALDEDEAAGDDEWNVGPVGDAEPASRSVGAEA